MCRKLNLLVLFIMMLGVTNVALAATDPYPADSTTHSDKWVILSWSSETSAVSFDVYFGDNYGNVEAGIGDTFQGNQTLTSFIVGFPGFPLPDGLIPGTTYYWRIDELDSAGVITKGTLWSFYVPTRTAYDPFPSDGAEFMGANVTLSWKAGMGAILHYVYFGDNWDDVEAGAGGTYQGPVRTTSFASGELDLQKTYYWRIDEFDGTDTYKGAIWRFRTVSGQWEKLNGPYGCYVGDITVDPHNSEIVYMATNIDGVYKSFDAGETWSPINNGIPSHAMGGWCVAVNPANPQNLYYGAWDAGPCVSYDGGKSWEYKYLSDCTCTLDISISRSNPYIVYVADQMCVWKSVDYGENWEFQGEENGFPVNSNHYAVTVDPQDPDLVYAAGGDVNLCWFWKTTTGGKIWEKKNHGLDPTKFIWAIVLHPTNKNVIYIGTDHGVYKTIDGAESWIPMNQGLTNVFIRDMAIDPVNPDVLYVATWNGLFRSLDAASHWERISGDFLSQCIKTIDLDSSNSRIVYAGIWGGIRKSMDSGDSWTFQSEGLKQDLNVARYSLAIDSKDPNVIYVGTLGGGVAKSTDAGKSFEYINNGLEIGYCQGIYLSPHDSQTLFCYTRGGHFVYKSVDGGSSWFISNTGLPQHYFYSMCGSFDPHNPEVFYLGTYADGAYKTNDAGLSWFPLNMAQDDLIVRAIVPDPINRGTVYAATYAGILKSKDFGHSWFPSSGEMDDLTVWSVAIAPSEPLILYAGGRSSGVFTSGDGGQSWIPCDSEIQGKMVRNILVHPTDPLTVYVGTYFDGIFLSTNGGQSWQPFNDGLSSIWVKDINFDNPYNPSCLYVGTGNGVYKWTAHPSP